MVVSEDNQEQRDHFLALAASLEEQEGEEGGGDFFISKHWLRWGDLGPLAAVWPLSE